MVKAFVSPNYGLKEREGRERKKPVCINMEVPQNNE